MTIGFFDLTSTKRVPDRVAKRNTKPVYSLMSFGDGYESRISIGTNRNQESYVLSFTNRPIDEIDSIAAFLDERKGVSNFQLTLPDHGVTLDDEKEITVFVKEYNRTYFNEEIASLTVTLNREYGISDDAPGLTLVAAPYAINEGATLTVNVTSIGIEPQTLYWQIINTTVFDFPTLAGTFSLTGDVDAGTGQFDITPAADVTTEGPEQYTLSITSGGFGQLQLATTTVTVNDTSRAPETIRFTNGSGVDLSLAYIQEPSQIDLDVESTNSDYSVLYWTLSGPDPINHFNNINGSIVMSGDVFFRSGQVTLSTKVIDGNTSDITYTLYIHKDSITGPIQDSITVVITPNTYYQLVDSPGGNVASAYYFAQNKTYTVYFDTGYINPALYYWTIEDGVNSVDFTATQGTFSTTGTTVLASGNFSLTTEVQGLSEPKNFTLRIKAGGFNGTVIATAPITLSTGEDSIYVASQEFSNTANFSGTLYNTNRLQAFRYTPQYISNETIEIPGGATYDSTNISLQRYSVEFNNSTQVSAPQGTTTYQNTNLNISRYVPDHVSQTSSPELAGGQNYSSSYINITRY